MIARRLTCEYGFSEQLLWHIFLYDQSNLEEQAKILLFSSSLNFTHGLT